MALVNQSTGSRQGNANYILYKLAAASGASCTSSASPASSCVFYDVPSGSTIAMPCANGTLNCNVTTSGDTYGVLSGYSAGAGYDLATGLGSINAANLLTKWATANTTLKKSTTTLTLNNGKAVNITHGQSVPVSIGVASTGSGTPTGNASLIANEGPNGTTGATDGVQGFVLEQHRHGVPDPPTRFLAALIRSWLNIQGMARSDRAHPRPRSLSRSHPKRARCNWPMSSSTRPRVYKQMPTLPLPRLARLPCCVSTSRAKQGTRAPITRLATRGARPATITLTDNGSALDGGTFALNSLGLHRGSSHRPPRRQPQPRGKIQRG